MKTKLIFVTFIFTLTFTSTIQAFCYEEAGKEYNINPLLLRAISKVESNVTPRAMNTNLDGTLDIGLMQINSSWVKTLKLNPGLLLSNPCYNLKTGAYILSRCIDQHGYTWEAMGCYNATDALKRVRYSWKIFNELKTEDKKLKRLENKRKTENEKFLTSRPLNLSTSHFYFRVRDKDHEPSAMSNELTAEDP